MIDELLDLLARSEVFDLSQPYYVGMPHHPVHPPFQYGLSKAHGDYVRQGDVSSASEAFALGGHVGTHIDALCHFSRGGKLNGGFDAEAHQSYRDGLSKHGVETIDPMLRRGILLDAAGDEGVDVLPEDFVLDADRLERIADREEVEIRAGDVVLIRTGWARYWDDPRRYINEVKGPGPNLEAAQWLSSKAVHAGGSDTIAFEHVPSDAMPVHVHFLVESAIHIIEALDMEGLAAAKAYEFAFLAAPLKVVGGTGAPIRPMAAVLR